MAHTRSQEASQGIAFTMCNPVIIAMFTSSLPHIPLLDHMICEGI
jgi:hypothetical protein